jgi:carbon storage regulator
MLVLSRKVRQTILIGENIRVTVTSIRPGRVRIAVQAPREMPVFREELLQGSAPSPQDGTVAEAGRPSPLAPEVS